MTKPILCLDFDGVIHSYTSGWKGADVIPDPPVPGAMAFLWDATDHFRVAIFSSRSNQPGGMKAMITYVAANFRNHFPGPADRQQVEARNATIATLEARNRRVEGALRDMTQAASQAGRVLDEVTP